MNLAPIGAGIDHAEAQPPSLLARLTGKSLERSNRHVESESRLQQGRKLATYPHFSRIQLRRSDIFVAIGGQKGDQFRRSDIYVAGPTSIFAERGCRSYGAARKCALCTYKDLAPTEPV
jgi:hypothetical protein